MPRHAGPARRRLLLALAAAPWLGAAQARPAPLAGLQRAGRGAYRRFGFLIYEATLWAGADPQRPPLALRLDYARAFSGAALAQASVEQMRRLGAGEAQLRHWDGLMRSVFPDVEPGDHLLGAWRADGAHFFRDERLLGSIDAPGFAEAFFGIWLDPRTSAPALRAALLRKDR